MPGLYAPGHFDLAGFACGVVERSEMLGAHRVREGDAVIGIPSSGLHSNGFSLVRALVADGALAPDADLLLAPTRLYVERARAARGGRRERAGGGPHHRGRHPGEPAAGAARGPHGGARPLAVGARGRRSTPSWRPGGWPRTRPGARSTWASACAWWWPRDVGGRGDGRARRRAGGGAGGGRRRRGPDCLRGPGPSGWRCWCRAAGTNLQSLIDSVHRPGGTIEIVLVVGSKPDAFGAGARADGGHPHRGGGDGRALDREDRDRELAEVVEAARSRARRARGLDEHPDRRLPRPLPGPGDQPAPVPASGLPRAARDRAGAGLRGARSPG